MALEDIKPYLPILRALIELHAEINGPVKSNEIAYRLGKSPGTIRGILNTLSKMGYVTGIPGPKGGYIPTTKAFMAIKAFEKSVPVKAFVDKNAITLNIEKISISTLASGEIMAEVKVEPPLPPEISTKKIIHIEATYAPVGMFITGEIVAVDPNGRIDVKVSKMVALPEIKGEDIATKELIVGTPEESIREVAEKMALHHIRSVPIVVDHDIRGMFSCQQLAESVASGIDLDTPVRDRIVDIPTLSADASIRDILRTMDATGVGRILLIKNGKPIGIVTRTDVLRLIVSQYAKFEEGEEGNARYIVFAALVY